MIRNGLQSAHFSGTAEVRAERGGEPAPFVSEAVLPDESADWSETHSEYMLSGHEAVPASPVPLSTERNGAMLSVEELSAFYAAAPDARERALFAADLASVFEPEAVRELLRLYGSAPDAEARRNLLYALGTAAARQETAVEISRALQAAFRASDDPEERGLIEEVMAEAPSQETADFLRALAAQDDADPYERLAAAEGLMRLSAYAPEFVSEGEIQALQERLRIEAAAAEGDPDYQAVALMALGGRKEDNQAFFGQMEESAQDPEVRALLVKLQQ